MNKMNENDFNLDEMLEDYVEDIRNRENWDISFEEYKKKTIESYSLQKRVKASREINGGGEENE